MTPPGPPARRRLPGWLARPLAVFGALLVIGAAAAVVFRVLRTAATLPPSTIEPALVDVAYGQYIGHVGPGVGGQLLLTGLHLRIYTALTWGFDRGPSVLVAARELSVAASAVLVLGLIVAAALLRVRSPVIAVALGLLAVCGPVITVLTPVGPGGLAAAWLAVAAAAGAAAAGTREVRWIAVGMIALLVALATSVVLVVPFGVGTAAAVAGGRLPGGARVLGCLCVLALTGGVALLLWRAGALLGGPAVLDREHRGAMLGVVIAVAAAGLVSRWVRPVAIGLAAGAGFALAVGPGADALLPALVVGAIALVAVLVQDAIDAQPEGGPVLARRAAAVLAAVIAISGSTTGVPIGHTGWHPPDHSGPAAWVADNLDHRVTLVAPASVWPDLQRDLTRAGLPDGAVRTPAADNPVKPDELVVALDPDRPPGIELARFDSLVVLSTRSELEYLEPDGRASAGAQLANNPRLRTGTEVRAALLAGRVDPRAMTLLAELCRDHEVTVAATGNPAHESGSPMPHRILTVSEVDGQPVYATVLDWIRAQQPPYAPADIAATPAGTTLRWRIPARLDQTFS